MRPYIPEKFTQEVEKLKEIWINNDLEYDEVVEKYASDDYKKYRERKLNRRYKLLQNGVIED